MNSITNCFRSVIKLCRQHSHSYNLSGPTHNGQLSKEISEVKLLTHRQADLSEESYITKKSLPKGNIGKDIVAVRIQDDIFTDFENRQIVGHKNTVARVIDAYNPRMENFYGISRLMGAIENSGNIATKENRNALNVTLMPREEFEKKILNSPNNAQQSYGGKKSRSWVVAPLENLLSQGAKVYSDVSAVVADAYIITLPETTKVDVEIYPVKK